MHIKIAIVNKLLLIFRVNKEGAPGADSYTGSLQKHMTPYITTQVNAHTSYYNSIKCNCVYQT